MQKEFKLHAKYFKKSTNYNKQPSNLQTPGTRLKIPPRYNNDNQSGQFGNQRTMTVAGARETVGSQECKKPKRVKDYTYHNGKDDDVQTLRTGVFTCKQEQDGLARGHGMKRLMTGIRKHLQFHGIRFRRSYRKIPFQLDYHWNRVFTLLCLADKLMCYQVKDKVVPNNSQVKFTKKEVEDHHRISSISKKTKSVTAYNDSSNSRTSNVNAVCAECGKCVFNSNHDACVSKYLNDVNARTKKPKVVPISASKPKRKMNKSVATPHKKTVASDTTIQKPKSYFKELYENTNKAWKWWIEKKCPSEYKWTQTTPSRPSLKWKPTGRIFSNVRLRWIPTGKLLNSCTGKVDSEPTHGSIVDIPHIHACKQTLGLSAGTSFNGQKQQRIDLNADALYNAKQENLRVWLLKMLISKKPAPFLNVQMTSVHISSGLVLHQMTSDHNRSELGIQDHNNEQSSSKLVPKVVP
ncbi:hypothetical protein Tco_0738411 [Tanacetum coccineum]